MEIFNDFYSMSCVFSRQGSGIEKTHNSLDKNHIQSQIIYISNQIKLSNQIKSTQIKYSHFIFIIP